jgi:predicted RNase H-like HicB family nuclease
MRFCHKDSPIEMAMPEDTRVYKGDFMKKDFNVIIEKDEDGYYVASVSALKGCHTQAKSLDVLMERIREAIELCLEEMKKKK